MCIRKESLRPFLVDRRPLTWGLTQEETLSLCGCTGWPPCSRCSSQPPCVGLGSSEGGGRAGLEGRLLPPAARPAGEQRPSVARVTGARLFPQTQWDFWAESWSGQSCGSPETRDGPFGEKQSGRFGTDKSVSCMRLLLSSCLCRVRTVFFLQICFLWLDWCCPDEAAWQSSMMVYFRNSVTFTVLEPALSLLFS